MGCNTPRNAWGIQNGHTTPLESNNRGHEVRVGDCKVELKMENGV